MADTKVSAMTNAAALAAADEFHIVQSAADRAASAAQMRTFAATFFHPGYVAGRWYMAKNDADQVLAGVTLSTIATRFYPFTLVAPITVSDLGARVTTLFSGGLFRVGIYATGTNGYPTGTVLAGSGAISTTSAASVNGAVSGGNVTLEPGIYWMAAQCDNSTAILQSIGLASGRMPNMVGSTTQGDITATNGWNGLSTTTIAYAGGLGDVTAATWTFITNGGCPAVHLKAA